MCPINEGSSAETASVLQSQTPVSMRGKSVNGPKYHQISPNSHPHATPAPRFEDSLRNNNPKLIPIRELTSRWTSSPCTVESLVSKPTTFDNTPVCSMMGLDTSPPAKPANAPQPSDCS